MLGRRQAIHELAASRHTIWIGALLVFSAALAREYDQEFILWRPWIMAVPFAASLVSSLLLWCLLWLACTRKEKVPFWSNYRVFLGLFWMTAPLAWLYAIPYERFLTPVGAVQANYATLGVVAAWRVFLMIRVAQVWTGRSAWGSIVLVLTYANAVLLAALIFAPWPVIDMMGGNRDPAVSAEVGILAMVLVTSFFAMPVLAIMAIVRFAGRRQLRAVTSPPKCLVNSGRQVAARSLWLVGISACLVLLAIAPFTQWPLKDQPTPDEKRQLERERVRREREEMLRPSESPSSN